MKVMQSDNALICIMDLTKWKKKGRGVYLPRCRNEYHGILAYNYSDNFLEDLRRSPHSCMDYYCIRLYLQWK